MHQWIVDSGSTPYMVVDVNVAGVEIPPGYAQDGKLVLNMSYDATDGLDTRQRTRRFSMPASAGSRASAGAHDGDAGHLCPRERPGHACSMRKMSRKRGRSTLMAPQVPETGKPGTQETQP